MTQAIYQGFILSRQQYSSKNRQGLTLCYWLSSESGPIKVVVENQQAVFFIAQQQLPLAQTLLAKAKIKVSFKAVNMRHFSGVDCTACYFNDSSSLYKARAQLEEQINIYEGDIRHSDRFLMERFIKGGVWVTGEALQKNGFIEITQAKLKANPNYTPQLASLSLDIECNAEGVLFSVGLVGNGLDCVLMIGEPQPHSNAFSIDWCVDEINLLQKLQCYITSNDPDVIVGWNVYPKLYDLLSFVD